MKRSALVSVVLILGAVTTGILTHGQQPPSQVPMPTVSIALDQLTWTKMTDGSGRETADLFGDRTKADLYGYLVRWPKKAIAKAHSHPDDRHAIFLSGTFYLGHGHKFDAARLERRSHGTYFTEPAGEPHFGATRDGETPFTSSASDPIG
jgi:hypothetical protein